MELILTGTVALLTSGLTLFSGFGLGTLLMPAFALFFPVPLGERYPVSLAVCPAIRGAEFGLSDQGGPVERSLRGDRCGVCSDRRCLTLDRVRNQHRGGPSGAIAATERTGCGRHTLRLYRLVRGPAGAAESHIAGCADYRCAGDVIDRSRAGIRSGLVSQAI
jgi:hypothetical protein